MDNKNFTIQELNDLGVNYTIIEHQLVHTIAEMEEMGITEKCNVCKNFFLRDAKGKRHFVVTLPKDKEIHVQDIAKEIGSTRLSFGSEERLQTHLKLIPGQVGPLSALLNPQNTVEYVFDKALIGQNDLGIHPNENTATLIMSFEDIKKVVQKHGHIIHYIS